ncbi:hypothetical protein [Pseudomonas amygdali]|nr:hypothetical protein [Pseudomonas amygdali]RMT06482.1 hypothetical protein ALP54_03734 [Pseudomonas amygdali pv. lachrymans]
MMTPQDIASSYINGKAPLSLVMNLLRSMPSIRRDFVHEILFTTSLLNPNEHKLEGIARSFERGSNAMVELFAGNRTATKKEVARLVSDVQSIIYANDLGREPKGTLSDVRTKGIIQIYLSLQSKSPRAAHCFLAEGLSELRSKRIFEVLDRYIDKPLIIDAAMQAKSVDKLHKLSGWDDCLPHLSPKRRDAYLGKDLGL